MNTPSKEALDAAFDLFKHRYCFGSDNDNAAIIDRHFEPLRQRAEQDEARVKELDELYRDLRVAYEQNAEQCVKLNRELGLKKETTEWLNGTTIQRARAEQAEARVKELEAALRGMIKNAERDGDTRLAVQKALAVIARHAAGEPEAQK